MKRHSGKNSYLKYVMNFTRLNDTIFEIINKKINIVGFSYLLIKFQNLNQSGVNSKYISSTDADSPVPDYFTPRLLL